MKKVLAVLLAAILICTTLVTNSFAAESGNFTIESKTVKTTDDTFQVNVTFSNATQPVGSMGITDIQYETTNFELVKGEWNVTAATDVKYDYEDGVASLQFKALEKDSVDGKVVFIAEFKILATAKAGTTEITAAVSDDIGGEREAVPGKITIECGAHNYGDYVKTKEPTCTEKGVETSTCSKCGATQTREIAALGHNFGEYVQTTAPTCTEKGVETATCSRCDATQTREVAATGHSFGEWAVSKAATCTEKGEEARTCSKCNEKETREIAALGHDFGEYTQTKAPTCTEKGEETSSCSRCDEKQTREIAALGHSVKEWTVSKEATLEAEGERTGTCETCHETVTEVIPKLTKEVKTEDGKVVVSAEEPFTGYTTVNVMDVATTDADSVDGKAVVGGYGIFLFDQDLEENIAAEKVVTAKVKLTDAMKAAYKDFVVAIGGKTVATTVEDDYVVFSAAAGDLEKVVLLGTKVEQPADSSNTSSGSDNNNSSNNSTTSPETGDAAGAALAVTVLAAAAAGIVLTKKKRRA